MIDRVIVTGSVRESEAETEVRDLIAVDGRLAGPVAARSQTSTKPIAARPSLRESATIARRAWRRLYCQTVGRQTDMIFIGTGIGRGRGTEIETETETETVTEIVSETVIGIVTATRIAPLALVVTTRLIVMSVSAATVKRNVSAPTVVESSKKMSMTSTTMRNRQARGGAVPMTTMSAVPIPGTPRYVLSKTKTMKSALANHDHRD